MDFVSLAKVFSEEQLTYLSAALTHYMDVYPSCNSVISDILDVVESAIIFLHIRASLDEGEGSNFFFIG